MRQWIAILFSLAVIMPLGCSAKRQTLTIVAPPLTITLETEYLANGENGIEQR